MHCPACERKFSFMDSFKIYNPFKYKCPSCGTLVTSGRVGVVYVAAGAAAGLAAAAVAIYMTHTNRWNVQQCLSWFGLCAIVTALPLQWLWWRKAKLEKKAAPAALDMSQTPD